MPTRTTDACSPSPTAKASRSPIARPRPALDAGAVSVVFSGDRQATLAWPGRTVSLVRHDFRQGADVALQPRTGWWWNPAESGRGFSIEVQGDHMFFAAYMYDGKGNPVWYIADMRMSRPGSYTGPLLQFAGGQTLAGSYRAATPIQAGSLALEVISPEHATLQLDGFSDMPGQPFDIEPQYGKPRAASASPKLWLGSFDKTTVSTYGSRRSVNTIRVPLMTWRQPLASDTGGYPATYAAAGGTVSVTWLQTDEQCTYRGAGQAELFAFSYPEFGDVLASELTVHEDGAYTGEVLQAVPLQMTETCDYGSGPVVRNFMSGQTVVFPFSGTLGDGRMAGTVPASRIADITSSGSWDFARRF
jgi:hypothetical protein